MGEDDKPAAGAGEPTEESAAAGGGQRADAARSSGPRLRAYRGRGRGEQGEVSGWFGVVTAAIIVALFLFFFDTLSTIILVFILAASIAALLRPLASMVTRRRETLAGGLLGAAFWVVGLAVAVLLGGMFASQLGRLSERWPAIEQQLNGVVAGLLDQLGVTQEVTIEDLLTGLLDWLGVQALEELLARLADWTGAILVALALIVFGSVFMLSSHAGHMVQPVLARLPRRQRVALLNSFRDLEVGYRGWLLGLMVSMAVVGLLTWVGLMIVGLELALPLAVFAGLAELIPFLGPMIAFMLIALLALTEGPAAFLGVVVVWAVIQTIEPYLLQPMIMRRAVRIPPLVTLFTVVLWGRIFGLLGLFLAVPINLTIWAFVDHFALRGRRRR